MKAGFDFLLFLTFISLTQSHCYMFQTFNNTVVYWHIYIMHSTGHYKGITQVPTKVWPTTSTLGTDSIVSSLCTVQTTDTGAFSGACSALPANRAPTDKCCTHKRCVSSRGSWYGRAGSTAGWMPSDRCHIWTGARLKWKWYGLQLMKKQPKHYQYATVCVAWDPRSTWTCWSRIRSWRSSPHRWDVLAGDVWVDRPLQMCCCTCHTWRNRLLWYAASCVP